MILRLRTLDLVVPAYLIHKLSERDHAPHLPPLRRVEEYLRDGELDFLVIAYDLTARSALQAVKMVRQEGKRAGLLRLKTLWLSPEPFVQELARHSREVLVREMNRGQELREVQRIAPQAQGCQKTDGEVMRPMQFSKNPI